MSTAPLDSKRSIVLAATFFCGSVLALALLSRGEGALQASTNIGRNDMDQDGLTDLQERVLGTQPDRPDSDQDGYSDLEERARSSNPLDRTSVPASTPLRVGTCASVDNGIVRMVSAVYVDGGRIGDVSLELGVLLKGPTGEYEAVRILPRNYRYMSVHIYQGRDLGDRVVAVEALIPERIIQTLGQLNLFCVARGTGENAPAPSVSVLSLVNFSGVTMGAEEMALNYASTSSHMTGVAYRPLSGDDRIPSTWSGGEVCWQRTAAVGGTGGLTITHEVEAADCQPMDTYCSAANCAAGVGKPLVLPNPAGLAGG